MITICNENKQEGLVIKLIMFCTHNPCKKGQVSFITKCIIFFTKMTIEIKKNGFAPCLTVLLRPLNSNTD